MIKHKKKMINSFISNEKKIVAEIRLITGEKIYEEQIVIKGTHFKRNGKMYLITPKYLDYSRTFKKYVGIWHENCSVQIKQSIDIDQLKDYIKENTNNIETINNVDPAILNSFTESTVIQKVLAGAEMDTQIRFIKLAVIISTILSGICVLLLVNISGIV